MSCDIFWEEKGLSLKWPRFGRILARPLPESSWEVSRAESRSLRGGTIGNDDGGSCCCAFDLLSIGKPFLSENSSPMQTSYQTDSYYTSISFYFIAHLLSSEMVTQEGKRANLSLPKRGRDIAPNSSTGDWPWSACGTESRRRGTPRQAKSPGSLPDTFLAMHKA